MKKLLCLLGLFLCLALQSFAYEENTISDIYNDGAVIKMTDGSMYKVYDYDTATSGTWMPMTDVVITFDKIINVDDEESVDYEYQMR